MGKHRNYRSVPAAWRKRTGRRTSSAPDAYEDAEMVALFQWADMSIRRYPELAKLFHIPNGGHRFFSVAVELKRQGVKAGVPDVCLPVQRGGFAGIWIEMKRQSGTYRDVTEAQAWWHEQLALEGYDTAICFGWVDTRDRIVEYLSLERV